MDKETVRPGASTRASVVYLVSTLRRAGPTAQLFNLVRHLDRGRFEPVVVTLSPEPRDSMRGNFDAAGVPVRAIGLSRLRSFFTHDWRERIGRAADLDWSAPCIVHSQGVRADAISARSLAGLPRVATARNDPHEDYVMKYGPLFGVWMAHAQLRAFAGVSAVAACSATIADVLRRHGIESEVIRNGVDTARFRPAALDRRAALRRNLGLEPLARVGICIGSLVRRKDPLAVVKALRMIDDPGLVMIFVGKGELEERCRTEAGDDSRIRFAGQVEDVLPYLQAADFLVSASRSEGLPNSVLEAMACGLPSVLSDIAPHAELLQITPKAGVLFRRNDAAGLAAAIRQAARPGGPETRLTADEAQSLIGAEATGRRYQELYLRLLKARP